LYLDIPHDDEGINEGKNEGRNDGLRCQMSSDEMWL
jgi:hypothetical protein